MKFADRKRVVAQHDCDVAARDWLEAAVLLSGAVGINVVPNCDPNFFFLPKLISQLILIDDDISIKKNSGSNFSVHPKGPKFKMAAKMAAVTRYFNISAPIHCRTKI